MDQYLKPSASLFRLIEEMQEYGGLVVAVDFDNTLFDFHKRGETYHQVIALLQRLKKLNCTIVCWTANEDENFVRQYCIDNEIPLDIYNDHPSFWKEKSRKIYYNALLDDRAGLIQVYNELLTVCEITEKRKSYQPETFI